MSKYGLFNFNIAVEVQTLIMALKRTFMKKVVKITFGGIRCKKSNYTLKPLLSQSIVLFTPITKSDSKLQVFFVDKNNNKYFNSLFYNLPQPSTTIYYNL